MYIGDMPCQICEQGARNGVTGLGIVEREYPDGTTMRCRYTADGDQGSCTAVSDDISAHRNMFSNLLAEENGSGCWHCRDKQLKVELSSS